jgi:hypothetical protein
MKTKNKWNITGIIPAIAILLLGFFFSPGCASKYTFATSSVVPAAEGTIKVTKDNNNNYSIDLNVKRLADPKRLTPPKNMYIVWMEGDQNAPKNIGQLKTSSHMFSSELKSSLKTVSSYKPTAFYITAEDNSDVQSPQGPEVLRAVIK